MRLPDEMLKSVCFLCVPTGKAEWSFNYGGTAFFISIPSETIKNRSYVYLVTARHNVDRASNMGRKLHVRLNRKAGGAGFTAIEGEWFFSENPGEDVAVFPWRQLWDGNELADVEFRSFHPQMFALNPVIENEAIGIGDEIMIVGLFSQRHGNNMNQPIVRSGIISAMPTEPLTDDSGYDYDAYLAEVRSIGGLSGSPVMVIIDPMRPGALGVRKTPPTLHSVFYLLGMVRGHWDIKKEQAGLDYADNELQQVNMGIAQITPIHDVMRVVMSDELKKLRRKGDSQKQQNK